MDDLSFIHEPPEREVSVIVRCSDGTSLTIDGLDFSKIEKGCPVLALALERQQKGFSYTFEGTSPHAVISFLRHVYDGDYTFCEAGFERPISLLLHLHVLRLAHLFYMVDLQHFIRNNLLQEIERARDSGNPGFPLVDLCEGIRYLYSEMREYRDIQEMITHYCVSCFTQHHLGANEAFRQTAFESPMFHRDLQQANNRNDFGDDGAMFIVQLPVCADDSHEYGLDFTCQLHTDIPVAQSTVDERYQTTVETEIYNQASVLKVLIQSDSYKSQREQRSLGVPQRKPQQEQRWVGNTHRDLALRQRTPLPLSMRSALSEALSGLQTLPSRQAPYGSLHRPSPRSPSTDSWTDAGSVNGRSSPAGSPPPTYSEARSPDWTWVGRPSSSNASGAYRQNTFLPDGSQQIVRQQPKRATFDLPNDDQTPSDSEWSLVDAP